MEKITPVDIQHKSFKKALQGYDRADVDQLPRRDHRDARGRSAARAALEAEIADLKERISHFKAMEESLQNTLVLAQRTADEVKASAHKEADLIASRRAWPASARSPATTMRSPRCGANISARSKRPKKRGANCAAC